MDNLIDHIVSAVAVVIAAVAAWFARKSGKNAARASLEAVVRDACDYAIANPAKNIAVERVALDAARLGDVRTDGKRDFSDAQLTVAIRAELARRAK
jgi:hypothetical protein